MDRNFRENHLNRLFRKGQTKQALKICYQSIKKNPRSWSNHFQTGYFMDIDIRDEPKALSYGLKHRHLIFTASF